MENLRRAIVIGQSIDKDLIPRPGFWDTREIITSQDINGLEIEIYNGPVRSESYDQLVARKAMLDIELLLIVSKIDAIDVIKNTIV